MSRGPMMRDLEANRTRNSRRFPPIVVEDSKYLPVSSKLAHTFVMPADRNWHRDVQDGDDVSRQARNKSKVQAHNGGIQLGFGMVSGRLKTSERHCSNATLFPITGTRLIENDEELCPWQDFVAIIYVLVF